MIHMPDKRHHRGRHPDDDRLFAPDRWDDLRSAVADLSWLLSRQYAQPSAVKVVGDRYNLDQRQRMAITRAACSDQARQRRKQHEVAAESLSDQELLVDGYNILTTTEAALSNGVILRCRDTAIRDIASIHGTYRKVDETPLAIELIGQVLLELGIARCTFLLDAPVSNSGRLKSLMLEQLSQRNWSWWTIDIVPNPDAILSSSDKIVATADSVILDRCQRWFNLADAVIHHIPQAYIIDLML
jgi:hypothetical protein